MPRANGAEPGRAAPTVPGSETDQRVSEAQAASEVQEYLNVRQQRRRLFPRAALVGLVAGALGTAFRASLAASESARTALILWAHHVLPKAGFILPVALGAAGAAMAVMLVRVFAPEASGSGIPHLEAVLHRMRDLKWGRVIPVKFLGGALGIGGGLALGREGPTVQMGGAVGAAVSDLLHVSRRDRLVLIAAGAGAGLAAAFNAPLAGVMFVLEEVQKDFRPAVFGATFIASAVSDIVTRSASGQLPVFRVPAYPVQPLDALPAFALLGGLCGVLGVIYNKSLVGALDAFARLGGRWAVPGAAVVGGAIGAMAWLHPTLVGGGNNLAEYFLDGRAALALIPAYFLARFVMSIASYGCGAPGGIFAPLLVLGALIGLGTGKAVHLAMPVSVPTPAVFAVVGMAAYFTAIVRAPLTGIVLIVEMTGSYAHMLPLVVASFCAYAVAEALGDMPIYERLLQRDLLRGGIAPVLHDPLIVESEVEPGSRFDGCEVREIGLPPGVVIVSIREGDREFVPTAATRILAHMRLTVVISPESKRGMEALHAGCESLD